METPEKINIAGEGAGTLQNNVNLFVCQEEKAPVRVSDCSNKSLLSECNNDFIHCSTEKEMCADAQVVSEEAVAAIADNITTVNNNIEMPSPSTHSESEKPAVTVQSLPCDPQAEVMEVDEQLGGIHFKNHTVGDKNGFIGETICPLSCVTVDTNLSAEVEESSSGESSSDSETESDSSSSTSTSSSSLISLLQVEEDEPLESNFVPLKTKGELLVNELPAVPELSITLPDSVELKPVGTVSSIIEQLVIIESLRDIPPLNEDSVVFKEDRCAAGKIFEIFGPVPRPFYVIRFNSEDHVESSGIKVKDTMYFAPSVEDFTQYIIPAALKSEKGSDASWTNDQEPPAEVLDYSDDEQERNAKQKRKSQNSGKKKQKAEKEKSSTSTQESNQFGGNKKYSRPYSRNSSASHFSRGRGSNQLENAHMQHHRPYFPLNYPEQNMMQQTYPYQNSQEYSMPLANNGHPASFPSFYGHYGNMQTLPPPPLPPPPSHAPPPHMIWPEQNMHFPYMQNSQFYSVPPPPPPPPPPPSSGDADCSSWNQ